MKMKTDEIKLRMVKFLNNTIDLYIPPTNFVDKLKNSTAKLWIEQNQWRFGKALDAFGDENHEIEIDEIMRHYEHSLFENGEMRLDIKTMIPPNYDWMKEYLPNKIILFKSEDFKNIFK